jgi:hypothetical protein
LARSSIALKNLHNTDYTSASWAPKIVPIDLAALKRPTTFEHDKHVKGGNCAVLDLPENLRGKNIETVCILVVSKKKVATSFSIGFTSGKYLTLAETAKFEPFSEKQRKELFGEHPEDYASQINELKVAQTAKHRQNIFKKNKFVAKCYQSYQMYQINNSNKQLLARTVDVKSQSKLNYEAIIARRKKFQRRNSEIRDENESARVLSMKKQQDFCGAYVWLTV